MKETSDHHILKKYTSLKVYFLKLMVQFTYEINLHITQHLKNS